MAAGLNALVTRLVLAGMTLFAIEWGRDHVPSMLVKLPSGPSWVIALLLFDIWMYAWHMANHRIGFLWRFHRAHHADTAMDTTTALRFHPGELVLSALARLPVLILLGMSFDQLVLFETVLNCSTLFHHSNLALPEKWDRRLRAIMVTPNMHRVHHSILRHETDSNFTSILSVWDRFFGTYRMRQDTRSIILGLSRFREEEYQKFRGFLATPLA